jgi:hypothetical protein
MANAFNSMLRWIIFQKDYVTNGNIIQFIPFVHTSCAFESPLFYSPHNHEGDFTIIPFAIGIHQADFSGRALFTLTHFKALRSTTHHFPSCLLPSIVDDTHIIGLVSIVSFGYEHFQTKLYAISLCI